MRQPDAASRSEARTGIKEARMGFMKGFRKQGMREVPLPRAARQAATEPERQGKQGA
jgi:hypothetical protein